LSHLATAERREYAEIAEWFAVWLQTPDLFTDWVGLRKRQRERETERRRDGEKERKGD
jgi:hypothetical protein